MLAPSTTAVAVWPIAGDVPDLQAIVWDQARTMADKEALLHAYQAALNAAQLAPAVVSTGTATATGTSLTFSAVTGTVQIGAVITGTGVPVVGPGPPPVVATTILNQQSGVTGGAGTYTTSQATTCLNAALVLTWQPPGINPAWPAASTSDPNVLMKVQQDQMAALRTQSILLQQYQLLLNDSATAPPASGP
jgi:hypothetical protein